MRRRLAEPSGTVRLTASVPTAQFFLADHLPALARAFPKLRVQVHATDRFVDLVQEGFDIAIRSHFAPLPNSALVQRRIGVEQVFVVAAPAYLEQRGAPLRPEDLGEHDGLLTGPAATVWQLCSADDGAVQVAPRPRLTADESRVLLKAAAAGLGVVCLPEGICRSYVESGALVRVLPAWTAGEVTTTVLVTGRRGQLPAVRVVVDFLADQATR